MRSTCAIWLVLALATPTLAQVTTTRSSSAPAPEERLGKFYRAVGELPDVAAAAFGPNNQLYVCERGAHRVSVFTPSGAPVRQWGSFGEKPDQFREPGGIVVAGGRTIYVADTGNDRIQAFRTNGRLVLEFGKRGILPGQFCRPQGLAGNHERLIVADTGNDRVQVFDVRGRFELMIGGRGREPGQFQRPADVALDAAGNIYVADADNNRVQKFSPSGQFLGQWGGWGGFPGLFGDPAGIDVVGEHVYVADSQNARVQVFTLEGRPVYDWGVHVFLPNETGKLHYPIAVAISDNEVIAAVGESIEDRLQIFTLYDRGENPDALRIPPGGPGGIPHFGLRADAADRLLVSIEPDTHSLVVADTSRPTPINITQFGTYGAQPGEFIRPTDVALDFERRLVYVCDQGNQRIQTFTLSWDPKDELKFVPDLAKLVRAIDLNALGSGIPDPKRLWPLRADALTLSPDGNLWVLDSRNALVLEFDPEFREVSAFGGYGSKPGELRDPTDLAFSRDGDRLYVVDAGNHRVQMFDRRGKSIEQWGRRGGGDGEFDHPFGIALDRDDHVYVTDVQRHCVNKFESRGRFVIRWGERGLGAGQFFKPRGVVCDPQKRVLVIDQGNHRCQFFSTNGEFLSVFGAREYTKPARAASKGDKE